MKPTTLPIKKLLFIKFLLLTLLNCGYMRAQEPIVISSDGEVQCMEFSNADERLKYAELIAEYGECKRVCEGSTITYTLSGGVGAAVGTQWLVTGGTIDSSSATECVVTWGPAGFATMSAVVDTGNGLVTLPEMCIQLIIAPEADFSIGPLRNNLRGCEDQDLYFENLSTTNDGTNLYSYYWDFGDGTFSSEFEPVHAYSHSGTYNVTLTVRNACNCISTITKRVRIGKETFPILCPSVVCEGEIATYSLPREGEERCRRRYRWIVTGGTIISDPDRPSIQVVWDHVDDSGFGYVHFSTADCDVECTGITTIKVPVIKNIGHIVGETEVCSRSQYKYSLPQWPATDFQWELIDDGGTGASLVYIDQRNEIAINTSAEGTIILRAKYQNTLFNCGGTAEIRINVKATSSIIGEVKMCPGTEGYYYLENGMQGDWVLTTPGGQEPVHTGTDFTYTFNEPGNYTLTATGTDFCAPEPIIITVYPLPEPPGDLDPGADVEVCPDTPLTYSSLDTPPGTIVHWQVINGTISGPNTGDEVTIVFNPNQTTYEIRRWTVSTTTPSCNSEVVTSTIHRIQFDPVIEGPSDVCANNYAVYQTPYLEGDDYQWSINSPGMGSVASGDGTPEVQILWNDTSTNQTAEITLTVTKCGIVETRTFDVNILTAPSITLNGPTQLCRSEYGTFSVSSTMPITSGSITWDFGDGTINTYPITAGTPNLTKSHNYGIINNGSLSYPVTVTITGVNGCDGTVSASKTITVIPAPVAQMTPDINHSFCNANEIDIEFEVAVQAGSTVGTYQIEWYKSGVHLTAEDGNTSIFANTYGFGTYRAKIINGNGCSIYTNSMTILQDCPQPGCAPVPSLGISYVNNCGTITATGTASGAITSAQWVAGSLSPTSSTSNPATFTAENAGNYDLVYLVNYTVNGQSCSTFVNETVTVPYIAGINYHVTCSATPGKYDVKLFNTTNFMPSHQPTNIQYYNGSTVIPQGSGLNDVTIQLSPGTYTFKIIVSDANGAPCEAQVSVVLPAMPNATINPLTQTVCFNTPATFEPAAIVNPESEYLWQFGDGTQNRSPFAGRVYQAAGTYTVTLTVTNKYGCSATSTATATMRPDTLDGEILSSSGQVCEGNGILLTYNNLGTPVTGYTWKRNGAVIPGAVAATYTATSNGSYSVVVNDANGCRKEIEAVDAAFLRVPVPVISGPSSICYDENGMNVNLTATPAPQGYNITYNWYFNGNLMFQGLSPEATFFPWAPGGYDYTLEVVQNNGGTYCSATTTHHVEVLESPEEPNISVVMMDCDSYMVRLEASSPSSGTYTWSNGMTGDVIFVNEGGPYMVTLTNASGCQATKQVYVPKDPDTYLWVFPTGCYSFCEKKELAVLLGPLPDFAEWAWLESGYGVQSGGGTPVAPYTVGVSGSYSLYLNNGLCSATSGTMDVTNEKCDCKLRYDIGSIKPKKEEFCFYEFDMYLENPWGTPISVTVTLDAGVGIVQPSVVVVPPGGGVFTFRVIPVNMMGGVYNIHLDASRNDKGDVCYNDFEVEFPPLCEDSQWARHKQDGGNEYENAVAKLSVVPNPVENIANMEYTYTGGKQRTIEIYSLMGILLDSFNPEGTSGIWNADISRYAAGQYIVVMKQDGEIIQQKNLIKK